MKTNRKEGARRVILIRMMLDIANEVFKRGSPRDLTMVALAVRLGQYEGRPMDGSTIARITNLPRSSVIRHLTTLRETGVVRTVNVGRRSVQFIPLQDEAPRESSFYKSVEEVVRRACERLVASDLSKLDT